MVIMEEYGIDKTPPLSKFRHACVKWYRQKHIAEMDGFLFDSNLNPKPPKDSKEKFI